MLPRAWDIASIINSRVSTWPVSSSADYLMGTAGWRSASSFRETGLENQKWSAAPVTKEKPVASEELHKVICQECDYTIKKQRALNVRSCGINKLNCVAI